MQQSTEINCTVCVTYIMLQDIWDGESGCVMHPNIITNQFTSHSKLIKYCIPDIKGVVERSCDFNTVATHLLFILQTKIVFFDNSSDCTLYIMQMHTV